MVVLEVTHHLAIAVAQLGRRTAGAVEGGHLQHPYGLVGVGLRPVLTQYHIAFFTTPYGLLAGVVGTGAGDDVARSITTHRRIEAKDIHDLLGTHLGTPLDPEYPGSAEGSQGQLPVVGIGSHLQPLGTYLGVLAAAGDEAYRSVEVLTGLYDQTALG